jgi:hypothetical protein
MFNNWGSLACNFLLNQVYISVGDSTCPDSALSDYNLTVEARLWRHQFHNNEVEMAVRE